MLGTGQYDDAYRKLNQAQREAVDHIDGPVLVLAGPGTGKTQIIAARIARILSTTDTLPENILCLTYTDAGTIAMRNRLNQFIGPDSYRVHIYTFHAFCNKVIQENLDLFGIVGLDAVSELEQRYIIREIIDHFPKGHPLKRYSGEIYFESPKLNNLYQLMKKEGWTPDYLSEKIKKYLQDIQLDERFQYKRNDSKGAYKKGDLKPDYYAEEKRMLQLLAGVETFETYESKMKKSGRYDFADMINWVTEAFRKHKDLLQRYQEQYHYFLVDEYQDTSGSQNQLLEMLISYWENPNIFCVGDDDQSIYRFQGANVENIRHFLQTYAPHTITLTENYRSVQEILDASASLIGANEVRLSDNKTLRSNRAGNDPQRVPVAVISYPNVFQELAGTVEKIRQLLEAGVPGNEIAVIYRKHDQSTGIITALKSAGIAVQTRRTENVLEEPLIKKLICVLRYLEAEHREAHAGEAYIFEMLHYDFFQQEPLDLAKISTRLYSRNFKERTLSWREELKKGDHAEKPDLFNPPVEAKTKRASDLIEGWISATFNTTLQQVVERVLSESGMMIEALHSAERTRHLQSLHTFFDFVKSECLKNPETGLTSLLATIDIMIEEKVGLPAQRVIYDERGVQFMTAHGSKGLEFDHVFLIGCNRRKWESSQDNNRSFKLPDNLVEIVATEDLEEHRRLFYVAMTRARKELQISYAEADDAGKDWEKSRFVAEVEASNIASVSREQISIDILAATELLLHLEKEPEIRGDLFNNAFVDQLLSNYSLSVTHLNAYLKCPTAFYFNNLIRVPSPKSDNMTFGSAVHYGLEMLFKRMNASEEKKFSEVGDLINDFRWYMKRNRDAFTEVQFKRRLEYGETVLQQYYLKYIDVWNKITSVERSYRNVVMEGIPLNGKLDKLEFKGNKVNVVDYKTGNYQKAKKKLKRPDELSEKPAKESKEPDFEAREGGDYWRQAVFYKLLMDYDKTHDWEMESAEFDFVEPDPDSGLFNKHVFTFSQVDLDVVKKQIHRTHEGIMKKQFATGCNDETCEWCSFVKQYYRKP